MLKKISYTAPLVFLFMFDLAIADVGSDCHSGNPELALRGCSIIIEGDGPNPAELVAAYAARANASEALGRHDAALADLHKIIELRPSAGAFNNLGNIHLATGDVNQALADYGDAIRLDPYFAGAYFNRGNVYSRIGELDHALADLNTAVDLNPKYAPAYFNRGIIFFRLGQLRNATLDFQQTVKIDPAHQGAKNALSQLARAPN